MIEIPQCANVFKASYCLKVHNAHFKLPSAFQDVFINLTSSEKCHSIKMFIGEHRKFYNVLSF